MPDLIGIDDVGAFQGLLAGAFDYLCLDDLDILETRAGHCCYATGPEATDVLWVCDECSDPHDPNDGPCPCQEDAA